MGRKQQRGGTRRPSSLRQNWAQEQADLQQRLGNQQEHWKEMMRRICCHLGHPRPTLKQFPGEKGRQVKFEATHTFKKGLTGRPKRTRRGLLAGGVAAGIMATVLGDVILSHVLGQCKKNKHKSKT